MHGDVKPYGLDHAVNATGSLMIPPLDALRDMLLEIGRQHALSTPLRVLHVGDKTDEVKDDGSYMAGKDWKDVRFVGNDYVGTFEDWKLAGGRAEKRADFILTSDYQELTRSRTDLTRLPAREVIDWAVNHSPLPVVGTRSQYVLDGGTLAVGASMYEQGREAGSIAINEPRLKEMNIILPDIYQALARASNN